MTPSAAILPSGQTPRIVGRQSSRTSLGSPFQLDKCR